MDVLKVFCQTGKFASIRVSAVKEDKLNIAVFQKKIGEKGRIWVFNNIAVATKASRRFTFSHGATDHIAELGSRIKRI